MTEKPRFIVAPGVQANELREYLNEHLNSEETKEYRLVACVSEPAEIDEEVVPGDYVPANVVPLKEGQEVKPSQIKKRTVYFHYPIFEKV
jgi:hypothetical protein